MYIYIYIIYIYVYDLGLYLYLYLYVHVQLYTYNDLKKKWIIIWHLPPDAKMGTSETLRACCLSRDSPGAGQEISRKPTFSPWKNRKVTCRTIKIEDLPCKIRDLTSKKGK